jgi:N-acetylglucosamine-6-phosphate deacetylase
MRLGASAALVNGTLVAGDVTVEDGEVVAVGVEPAGAAGIALPGFVDVHVNGIAGVDFATTDAAGYRRAGEALARTGVVAYQPTLVSAPPAAYADPLAVAREAVAAAAGLPLAVGVHLEGPFLSTSWAGAHDPAHLRAPDLALAERLLAMGPVTAMTLAPELPGAEELVERLVAAGVVVSCGHSDADAAAAHATYDRGARAITHVHNAHRRWRPRDPGLGGVAVARPDVTVQAIVDGVHLAPETAYATFLAAGPRLCLVTDAIDAALCEPGEYRLGGRAIHVDGTSARLPDGTLAGSLLTMDAAVRNLVALGAPLAAAAHAASTAPARLTGRDDLGALAPGRPAHVTVVDDDLRVVRTLVAGVEAAAPGGR